MEASLGQRARAIAAQPSLVERVIEAIVSEIVNGELPSNARLIQDELARAYGVSRQPVQQALLLLKNRGLVRDAPGRGLIVSPLDPDFVSDLYDVRAALDGLAGRTAARRGSARAKADGPPIIAAGRKAIVDRILADQIGADIAFHTLIGELSGNPLIGEATTPHWPYVRRVMAEVLRADEALPNAIWDEHAAILDAVIAGDADAADRLSQDHIRRAAGILVGRLRARQQASEESNRRESRRIFRS